MTRLAFSWREKSDKAGVILMGCLATASKQCHEQHTQEFTDLLPLAICAD